MTHWRMFVQPLGLNSRSRICQKGFCAHVWFPGTKENEKAGSTLRFSQAVAAAAVAWPSKLQRKLHPAGTLHCSTSGHPESSQGPSDLCMSYSQMLCQLSYSRYIQFGNQGVMQRHHRKRRQEISTTNSRSSSSGRQTQQFQCFCVLLVVAAPASCVPVGLWPCVLVATDTNYDM